MQHKVNRCCRRRTGERFRRPRAAHRPRVLQLGTEMAHWQSWRMDRRSGQRRVVQVTHSCWSGEPNTEWVLSIARWERDTSTVDRKPAVRMLVVRMIAAAVVAVAAADRLARPRRKQVLLDEDDRSWASGQRDLTLTCYLKLLEDDLE